MKADSFDQKQTSSDQPPSGERDRDHVHIPLIGEEEDDTEDHFRGTEGETSECPASSCPSLDLERAEQAETASEEGSCPQDVDQGVGGNRVLKLFSEQHQQGRDNADAPSQ